MKLIGIAGTNGSGKDTLSEILEQDYGWLFVSASRDLLIPELKRRSLPLERRHMAGLSAEWNRQTPGAVIDKAIRKFKAESRQKIYPGLVISSVRHPWEVDRIHQHGGKLIWVDADPKIRYDRIFSRGQGEKDKKSYEQFLAEEEREMTHEGDDATLNMSGVKAKADIFINNDSDDINNFKRSIGKQLAELI